MNLVLRPRRYYRKLGIGSLALMGALGAAAAVATLTEPLDPCWPGMLVLWCFFSGLCGWVLVAYRRESLSVSPERIIRRGVFRSRSLDLRDALELKWRMGPAEGSAVVRSDRARVAIDFGTYEGAERVQLIQFLRAALPEALQSGWPPFCEHWAAPLLDDSARAPRAGETRITRRRLDGYFAVGTLVVAIVGAATGWYTGQARLFVSPLIVLGLWLAVRWQTPCEGLLYKTLGSQPWVIPLLVCYVVTLTVPMLLGWSEAYPGVVEHPQAAALVLMTAILIATLCFGIRCDRQTAARRRANIPQAVARWAAAEQDERRA